MWRNKYKMRWDYSNVGIAFNKDEIDETLIRQLMECLSYDETDALVIEGTKINGPVWSKEYNNIVIAYEDSGKTTYQALFLLLNILFRNISVYMVRADGDTTRDSYSGYEITMDSINNKYYVREFDYYFNDFYEAMDGAAREYGRDLKTNYCKDNLDIELWTFLINKGTEKKYIKLVELIRKECISDVAEI